MSNPPAFFVILTIGYALRTIYEFRIGEGKGFLKLLLKSFATSTLVILILIMLCHLLGGR
ncbi:hypothetical protein X928_01520 [Petrotoga miotherma DSM 10691]|uniref:Uncharacterized protein n=2 Tax=Petrotoga TaxID=28236 RepID=A0A2K1PGW7_9BACT|nr:MULTISPECIES: hypothetical protein [Petrotoga]MDN5346357.1 hypothetical protein [Petrotoga sp.]PNS02035.1 hypothetical protein X928_01520 [Petrotoga miotherma DSM 10691]POZ92487.1 hypothetical protein AA81_07040 [Petrotoga halophila DSM 16923]